MYEQIASNKRKTWVLVTLFSACIIGVLMAFGAINNLNPWATLTIGAIISVIYCLISFFVADKVILATEGARKLDKASAYDIYNLVENLTIANGMPMPNIYLIDDPAPNAFATGRDPQHASIVFTTGLLSALNKTELEAVAAHELSHIKNYDIRLMTLVVVLVGLVILLSDLILRVTFTSGHGRNNDKGGGITIILIIAAIALAILSPLIAQLIKLAVSRTREYLADSSAALLTRHPTALASALEKIKTSGKTMKGADHATAHLYISNPFGEGTKKSAGWYQRLFATHPPIDERITKLKEMAR